MGGDRIPFPEQIINRADLIRGVVEVVYDTGRQLTSRAVHFVFDQMRYEPPMVSDHTFPAPERLPYHSQDFDDIA